MLNISFRIGKLLLYRLKYAPLSYIFQPVADIRVQGFMRGACFFQQVADAGLIKVRLLLSDISCMVAQQLEGLCLYSAIPSLSFCSCHVLMQPPSFQLLSPSQQLSAFPLKYSDVTSSVYGMLTL